MNESIGGYRQVPRVSIGMPVYNGETYIREAIDSLLAQTFTDFELIVSDNASTDGTEAICREYAGKDARIRYVRQLENKGAMGNFKFVLDAAIGEFFMWAADDDLRHPEFLKMAINVFDDSKSCGLVFCDYEVLDRSTNQSLFVDVAMYTSNKKHNNYLMRLLSPCPSLIYGLHRRSVLLQLSIVTYDFFDIHLTHWYSVHSAIKVIPCRLYVSGVYGKRIPYSLTGRFIDPRKFYSDEWQLLESTVSFKWAVLLWLTMRVFYFRNLSRLNGAIKFAKKQEVGW